LCDAPCVVVYNNIFLLRMRCCLISPPHSAALHWYTITIYTIQCAATALRTALRERLKVTATRSAPSATLSSSSPSIPSGLPSRDAPPYPLFFRYIRVSNTRVHYAYSFLLLLYYHYLQ
jgi:hypothetical protein